jgi:hypothetical protein
VIFVNHSDTVAALYAFPTTQHGYCDMAGIDVPAALIAIGFGVALNLGTVALSIYLRLRQD